MSRKKFGRMGRVLILLLAAAIILGGIFLLFLNHDNEEKGKLDGSNYSMFSWGSDAVLEKNRAELDKLIERENITEIYQEFSGQLLESDEAESFLQDMHEQNINVYALEGAAEWAEEEDGRTLIGKIKKAGSLNSRLKKEYRIKGIMADIEPYLLDRWDAGDEARAKLMESYADGIIAAYQAAQQADLELLICIPTFFDVTNRDILERLTESGCDGLAVMNYNREDEYGQIVDEVELAVQNQKRIICIYELQAPGQFDLKEINTYYHIGLKELQASREALEMQFGYDKLSFAYHYYEPLKELSRNK